MRLPTFLALLLSLTALPLVACDSGTEGTDTDMDTPTPMGGTDGGVDVDDPVPTAGNVPCEDESILEMDFKENVNPDPINLEGSDGYFSEHVVASGGGLMPTNSYVYARFTDAGLEKVAVSDMDALASEDWDIAFRRFVVRLNSGVSGPSSVTAARTPVDTDFATLDAVPEGLTFNEEQYFTQPDCTFVSDGAGIGGPGTVLSGFWQYPGCVQMTGNVYVVQLANGRHVKLVVDSYYEPTVQEECDTTDAVTPPTGSGNLRLRWAYLD